MLSVLRFARQTPGYGCDAPTCRKAHDARIALKSPFENCFDFPLVREKLTILEPQITSAMPTLREQWTLRV
jgi:hypothetical protein